MVAIRNQCKNSTSFSFTKVDKKEIEHLILNQDVNNPLNASVALI